MSIEGFSKQFDAIISSYSEKAGKAVGYCNSEYDGEAFRAMREAAEDAMNGIKDLLAAYLRELN